MQRKDIRMSAHELTNSPQAFSQDDPMSDFHSDIVDRINRRRLLARCGGGAGLLGLASLLADEGLMAPSAFADASTDRKLNPLAPAQPHFTARAKSVIWLFMNGGPSQVDTWNYRQRSPNETDKSWKGSTRTPASSPVRSDL